MYDLKYYNLEDDKSNNFNRLIIPVILIFFIVLYIIYGAFNTKKVKINNINKADLNGIENNLIIDGIAIDDNESIDDEDITFVDEDILKNYEVEETIKLEYNQRNKNTNKSVKHKINNLENKKNTKKISYKFDLNKLKQKDKRWHYTTYKIKKNDNIWKIAKKFKTSYKYIIYANNIDNPDKVEVGKIIKVPNKRGVYYEIQRGDTLYSISKKYNIDINILAKINNIKRHGKIYIGKKIFIPDVIYQKKNIPINNIAKSKKNDLKKSNIVLSWPVKGRISSGFGMRVNPVGKGKKFHCGIDISCNVNTPVKAAMDGKVIFSGWKKGYGKIIILRHKGGYISVYAHNSKNLVKKGALVKRGQIIAKSGMTGNVTGPHVHFEFRKYLIPLNPVKFLR